MADHPTVLIFVAFYLPGYKSGGPVRSIANLVETLGDEFHFRIVTGDRDPGDAGPYLGIRTGEWTKVGKAEVRYLAPSEQRLSVIARILRETEHDQVYLNSFFSPRFTILPLLALHLGLAPRRRVVLAPRGEFSPGALGLKRLRKLVYLSASRVLGFYRDIIWHASTEFEARNIVEANINKDSGVDRSAPPEPKIKIAKDVRVVDFPVEANDGAESEGVNSPLRIVFLSRISHMKNLEFVLDVLRHVKIEARLTIYGPHEDEFYWAQCRAAMTTLPRNVSVVYAGAVPPTEVPTVLRQHDLFFLPTLGENYGHAIVEAMEAGLRVLISDRTPWRGLAEAGIGYDLSLDDHAAFVRAIETEATRHTPRRERIERARAYLHRALETDEVLDANRDLFRMSPPPA